MSDAAARGERGDAFASCEARVREGDRDRFLASLFAPAARRPSLHALYAFDLDVRRIPERVRDPLAGEIRVQWWREVLEGERPGEAAAHPVAAALLATLDRHAVPREPLLRMLDAREPTVYGEPFPTREAFRGFSRDADGTIMRSAWGILAEGGETAPAAGGEDAGLALATCDVLRRLAAEAARGRCLVPADLLEAHGASCAEVTAGRASSGLRAALAALRGEARAAARRLGESLAARPSDAHAAFLPALLVPLYLDRMERADYDPFRTPVKVPQWRRQWRMWRLARRLSRR